MPVDRWELLRWMADREDSEPGMPAITGLDLARYTAGFADGDGLPWEAVAKAAAHLEQAGYITWIFNPGPNGPSKPPTQFFDSTALQRTTEVSVTAAGRTALVERTSSTAGPQINIVNSTVGQVALGDIKNIDVYVILDAMERSLGMVDASPEEMEEARSAIQRMREAGGTIAGSAAGSVLGAALRQALGLPFNPSPGSAKASGVAFTKHTAKLGSRGERVSDEWFTRSPTGALSLSLGVRPPRVGVLVPMIKGLSWPLIHGVWARQAKPGISGWTGKPAVSNDSRLRGKQPVLGPR